MKLVFATHNKNKVQEITAQLGDKFKIYSLADINCEEEIPETSDTIEGNAIQKARYVNEKFGYVCFADDTGLEIDALNGRPGVYTARYAGEDCKAEDNMRKVLAELKGEQNRKARFITVIALVDGDKVSTFRGIAEGVITEEKKGRDGFGYDPIFKPTESELTFAEMSLADKIKISHRGRAVRKFIDYLSSMDNIS